MVIHVEFVVIGWYPDYAHTSDSLSKPEWQNPFAENIAVAYTIIYKDQMKSFNKMNIWIADDNNYCYCIWHDADGKLNITIWK